MAIALTPIIINIFNDLLPNTQGKGTTKMRVTAGAVQDLALVRWFFSFLVFYTICSASATVTHAFENLIQAHDEVRKDLPAEPLNFAEPDWSIYHRTTHLHNQLLLLTSTCRHASARLLLSTPDSSTSSSLSSSSSSSKASSSFLRLSSNRNAHSNLAQAQFPVEIGNEPLTAEEGLPYIVLERNEDKEESDHTSTSHRFTDIFLRRNKNDNQENHDENKDSPIITTSMFVFGEEGRDLLSSEVALRIVQHICNSTNSSFDNENSTSVSDNILFPRKARIILVPVANPDGRRISEMGRRCDRTNAKDIDIDRNWPSFWKEPETENDQPSRGNSQNAQNSLREAVSRRLVNHDEKSAINQPNKQPIQLDQQIDENIGEEKTHSTQTTMTKKTETDALSSGPRPLSEPETRALKSLIEEYNPQSYVALRTGQLALTTPWDCNKPGILHSRSSNRLTGVLQSIKSGHCTKCKTGHLNNITGEYKCGTSLDHIFGTMNVQFVSGWYIYDGNQQQYSGTNVGRLNKGDCFRKYNPISEERFERVANNWMHAILNFTTSVRNWVVLEEKQGLHVAQMNASRSADIASERRSQALARGDADPEEEIEIVNKHQHKKRIMERFHELGFMNSGHSNDLSQAHSGHSSNDNGNTRAVGSGLFGASAAISTFALCLFIAKKFVFKPGTRTGRKNKIRRQPIKNA